MDQLKQCTHKNYCGPLAHSCTLPYETLKKHSKIARIMKEPCLVLSLICFWRVTWEKRAQMRVALRWNIRYHLGLTNVRTCRHILSRTGPLSSYTRQCFPPYQVQGRVILDSAFHRTRYKVELYSTVLSTVPGTRSSYTRQCFPPYQVQCRVILDSAFHRTRYNVELYPTMLPTVPGTMSSYTRHCLPPYQIRCRVILDSAFHRNRYNVELYSTVLSTVPGTISSSDRNVILQFFISVI